MNDFQQWFNKETNGVTDAQRFSEDVQEWMLDYQEYPVGLTKKLTAWLEAAYCSGYIAGYYRAEDDKGTPEW